MGNRITIKQNDFSHGMQSEIRNNNLVGQSQVFGAENIKHFDIYQDGKLQPQPSFERFNTVSEEVFGINVVGGKEDKTVYGLGKALDNWYGSQWQYRIRINASQTSSDADYVYVDLSQLGDDFWNNVNSDGSDVRISTVSGSDADNRTYIKNFDDVAKTGMAICDIFEVDDLYVYFGNTEAELISDIEIDNVVYNGYENFFNDDLYISYTLNQTGDDFSVPFRPLDRNPQNNNFDLGKFNYALHDGVALTTSEGITAGAECSLSFLLRVDATPLANYMVVEIGGGDLTVQVRPDGKLNIIIDLGGTLTYTTPNAISLTDWHYISVNYNKDDGTGLEVYIDGVLVLSDDTLSGNIDEFFDTFTVRADANMYIQMVTHLRNDVKPITQRIAEGLMHSSPTFWTEQPMESYSSITPTVSGIAIYEKDLSGTIWKEATYNGQIIKDSSGLYPMPSFIDKDIDGGFFFLSGVFETLSGSSWGGRAAFDQTLIDTQSTQLFSRKLNQPLPVMTLASDKEHYITNGQGGLDVYAGVLKDFKYTDRSGVEQTVNYDFGFTPEVYDAFPLLTSTVRYGYSLAMTGTRDSRASIEIWDLINLDPNTVVDLGTGNAKVIANIKGNLITVVDNYLQDEELSRAKPSLDFRLWQGQDNIKTLQSFKFDNIATVYPNDYQYTIDNRRSDLSNASVFYGEPSINWTGMWGIGIGQQTNQVGVSILYETSGQGRITAHHSIGNNLIVINEDGEIYKLNSNGDYNQTSTFESMVIDAGIPGTQKDITGIEVVLDKDLPVGQTITVSYKVDNGSYQLIGTCTDKVTEFSLADGIAFDNFNEMQLKIETTGGDASIVEYSVKVEYEEEVV